MRKRVTIVDIAKRSGVHFSTVGRALSGDIRIKIATRNKIQALAQKMGYVRDPMLSALSAYRKAQKPVQYQETLAWITSHSTRDGWKQGAFSLYYEGARRRALELGYRLEEFWLKQPGMTSERITKILFTQGIRGLLIVPLRGAYGHLSFDWQRFSSIAFGLTLREPHLNAVTHANYQNVVKAMRRLRALGHRRFGWANCRFMDERVRRQWKAGFWSEIQMLPLDQQLPFFSNDTFDESQFLAWFKRYRPTAILGCGADKNWGIPILKCLRKAGYAVPKDVSVAIVNINQKKTIFSGIRESSLQIGEASVDLLAGAIREGRRGLPEFPSLLQIEGTWTEGETAAKAPA